jgi:hypothetical protein
MNSVVADLSSLLSCSYGHFLKHLDRKCSAPMEELILSSEEIFCQIDLQ